MKRNLRGFGAAGSLFVAMFAADPVFAQKQGGILKMYSPDSPASMSIHEEATVFAAGPMMGVFNNLVMFDQEATAEQPAIDRARSGDWLVMERGGDRADLAAARRRYLARRKTLHGRGRRVHL
jgi:hypothetical protein